MNAEEVTKSKNEGRVAAGKRLVEWNRKNKADLLKNKADSVKNKAQVDSSDTSSVQVPTSPEPSRATFYGGGAVAILVGAGFALYLYREKKPLPAALFAAHSLESSNGEIFCVR